MWTVSSICRHFPRRNGQKNTNFSTHRDNISDRSIAPTTHNHRTLTRTLVSGRKSLKTQSLEFQDVCIRWECCNIVLPVWKFRYDRCRNECVRELCWYNGAFQEPSCSLWLDQKRSWREALRWVWNVTPPLTGSNRSVMLMVCSLMGNNAMWYRYVWMWVNVNWERDRYVLIVFRFVSGVLFVFSCV